MRQFWPAFRRRLLGIRPAMLSFDRLGFAPAPAPVRERLERIASVFADGYHAALASAALSELGERLGRIPREHQGFAAEGAAMALEILDRLTPWRPSRAAAFAKGAGAPHIYLVYVGLGWAAARLHRDIPRMRSRWDPLLGWLITDGYGFHEGFFHWRRYSEGQPAPKRLQGYDRNVFDQGLGRSLWFVAGADPDRIRDAIARFPPERQGDLWGGIGLAATYAGGADAAGLRQLRQNAADHWPHLAQGAAFAAKARQQENSVLQETHAAALLLCDMPVIEAASVTDRCLPSPDGTKSERAYAAWQSQVRRMLSRTATGDSDGAG